ncbi:MAG TPA: glycerate kinase [Desulfatiglandales bacterium]|nr:glycerate kinase [Desulfatiglandales bacterium]
MDLRQNILDIFKAGLNAVLPETLILDAVKIADDAIDILGRRFAIHNGSRIHVFGSGKASIGAAKVLEDIFQDRIADGLIVSNYHGSSLEKINVCVSAHPVPDGRSMLAAERLISGLSGLSKDDLFIYILSGGSSSLIEKPVSPLTIDELQSVSRLLMNAGASINELNAVRKHLSMIKGGRLGRMTKARGVVMVISDVIGDDLETIGSAPLYKDGSTFKDVWDILSKYNLCNRMPAAVKAIVEEGLGGLAEETPKQPPLNIEHLIIANNMKALQKARDKSLSLGINGYIMTSRLRGEARDAAKAILSIGEEVAISRNPFDKPVCLIFGGETTVTVRGEGKGGRNQEMCLSALREIGNRPDMVFLSAGTDGIDGNSEAAGAVVDCDSYNKAQDLGLSIDEYLENNDSSRLFEQTGDLIVTGPTGTNVMDITILLIGANKI